MPKTSLPHEAVETFLRREMPGSAGTVQPLVEGEDSQAFAFSQAGQAYVLRINRSAAGFHKDDYAYRRFCSSAVPIPAVRRVGQIDAEHAFCISDLAAGTTLQDLPADALPQSVAPTFELWSALAQVDVSDTTGFGAFDRFGRGAYPTWQAYVRAVLDPPSWHWESLASGLDLGLIQQMREALEAALPYCPEVRLLVHGDFGSNNVLAAADGRITAVLDWDNAGYGDPLFDVAVAHYWRNHLACMEAFAAYSEERLSAWPRYHERLTCYQLRIGLAELQEHAAAGHTGQVTWHQQRCTALLRVA